MSFENIIASIDAELAKLQQARSVLSVLTKTMSAPAAIPSAAPAIRKPCRPKKSLTIAAAAAPSVAATGKRKKRRKLSADARKRIREAALARWAKIKKAA